MTSIIRAELGRLLRRRTLIGTALASVAFAVVSTIAVFSSARESGPAAARGGTTIARLSSARGATEAFAVGASFVGFFVFVVFIALVATEFSSGTYRALLLREPHRLRLVGGKLIAALAVAAGAIALAEVTSIGLALVIAPSQDVDTESWFTLAGAGHGLANFATVFAGVVGWAVFGTTLAVIFRSVPLALGVGFAWAGPFENITVDSWPTGYRVYPGQVVAAVIQGGTPNIGLGRAALTAAAYVVAAAFATGMLLTRRDVTS